MTWAEIGYLFIFIVVFSFIAAIIDTAIQQYKWEKKQREDEARWQLKKREDAVSGR